MKRQIQNMSLSLFIAMIFATALITGCDNTTLPKDEGAIVSGTVTLPVSVQSKAWAVYIDNDYTVTNGFTKVDGGTVAGNSFVYNMPNVPAGTYYVYAIVYMGASVTGNPVAGDYIAIYGAANDNSPPASANCSIPAEGTVIYNMNAVVMDGGNGDDDDDEDGVTVSGTISLPTGVTNKPYLVIIDADTDGGNGYEGSASGFANGGIIDYSIDEVTVGSYYIYAIVYNSGTVTGSPAAGDYFGAWSAESISDWPNDTNKAVITATGTNDFDFDVYTAPDMDGGNGGEEGVTVSGTVSLPTGVTNKPYLVIIDADTDGGNGYEGIASGSANGGIIDYSIDGVTVGSYYIYAIVYNSGTVTGSPAAGDYFGAWSAESISDWPNDTNKASITADGANDFDFDVYTAPSMGGGNGGEGEQISNTVPFTDNFSVDSYMSTHGEVLAGVPVSTRTSSINDGILTLDAAAWENVPNGPYNGSYRCTIFFPINSIPDKTKIIVDFKANPNLAIGLSDTTNSDEINTTFVDITGSRLRIGYSTVYTNVVDDDSDFTPDSNTLYRMEIYISRTEEIMAYQLREVGSSTILMSANASIPENFILAGGLYLQTYRYDDGPLGIHPAQARASVDSVTVETFTGSVP